MVTGDAFGELMRAALAEEIGDASPRRVYGRVPHPVNEIVERDDGFIHSSPVARYLAGPDQWEDLDLRALDRLDGRTLDIGTGGGRLALALADRGIPAVGLDISAGAVEVAAARGVRETVCATFDEHAAGPARYDRFALFGNNLGLLGSRQRAPIFLAALAAMANPGAAIVAQGTDPFATEDPLHLAYHERNRAAGRMGGQLSLRVRYRHLATDWFDYLLCTPAELDELVSGTPWRLTDVDIASAPFYLATLVLR